jgi:DNA invertase Pin-like site-specific DNA recombinase
MMLEREREGIAKAKRERKYTGRKPTAKAKVDTVMSLIAEGVEKTEIAKRAGIGRRTVYRILERSQAE